MRSCRRQDSSSRRQTVPAADTRSSGASARSGGGEPAVRRYIHPIQTARPVRRGSTEDLLAQILENLAHQSALLEELLRRSEGNDPETK